MPAPRALLGRMLIVLAAVCYGLMPLFGTRAHSAGLDTVAVMAIRFAIAAAGLWTIVAIRRPVMPSWQVSAGALGLGATCWTLQSVGYLYAVTRLGASVAALLLFTYPLMVVIAAVLLKRQRVGRPLLIAFGLVAIGLLLVFASGTTGAQLDLFGVIAGVVSAVTYTIYILASEPLSRRTDPFLLMALALTGAAAATWIVVFARGGVAVSSMIEAGPPLLGLALLSTVVAAMAFLLGLKLVGASTAALLSCVEVVVACAVAAFALGDRLTTAQLMGCVVIVAAAVFLNLPQRSTTTN